MEHPIIDADTNRRESANTTSRKYFMALAFLMKELDFKPTNRELIPESAAALLLSVRPPAARTTKNTGKPVVTTFGIQLNGSSIPEAGKGGGWDHPLAPF